MSNPVDSGVKARLAFAFTEITESVARGKGTFVLCENPERGAPFVLALGAPTAVQVTGGLITVLGLRRDQVEILREQCDAMLRKDQ